MPLTALDEADFSFTFPEETWENHSTREAYDFRCGEQEQIMAVRHVPRKVLADGQLQGAVMELYRMRLECAQEHSGNSCRFESPTCSESPGRFDAAVFAHDLRERVFMQFGFFGTGHRIVVVSYYDYTGSDSPARFKQRANALFSSVKVSKRA
jgi:hypothetical protein